MASLVFCVSIFAICQAQAAREPNEKAPANDVERADETVRRARAEAVRYRIVRDDDPETKIELRAKPILKWSNPSEGALFGSVVLWTVEGRPEAVGSLYRWYDEKREFHAELKSLSTHPLKAVRDEEPIWDTGRADVAFRELARESAPADKDTRRTQQMREIARRFAAELVHPSKGRNVLRLMPQPVYRYEKLPEKVLDGALFTFVQGTDPEVFLLIEAEKTDEGGRWRYALSRMNMYELHVKLDDKEVWNVREMVPNDLFDGKGPYTILMLEY